jgi:hypothetical protein
VNRFLKRIGSAMVQSVQADFGVAEAQSPLTSSDSLNAASRGAGWSNVKPGRRFMAKRRTFKSKHNLKTAPQFSIPNQPGAGKLVRRSTTDELQAPLSNEPDQGVVRKLIEKLHPDLLGDLAYERLSQCMGVSGELLDMATPAAFNFQQDMRPKDGLERLTLTQALLAHGRVAWLTKLATAQTNAHALGIIVEACERASGTFVRLVRALGEYRQPRNSSPNVSIAQANVAHQQIVQNVQIMEGKHKEDDEQTRINEKGAAINAEAVPVIQTGIEVAEGRNLANKTLEEKHGAKKPGRKIQGRDELAAARRAVSHRRRAAKVGQKHH